MWIREDICYMIHYFQLHTEYILAIKISFSLIGVEN